MKEIQVNGASAVLYAETKNTAESCGDIRYPELFEMSDPICTALNIPCPDIAIYEGLIPVVNPDDFSITYSSGYTYHKDEHPELSNTLMMIALRAQEDPVYITGVLAHELRHIFQRQYLPELGRNGHAKGGIESLYHPEEIDADAYAIAYLVWHRIGIERAGKIVCQFETEYYPEAFRQRMEKAGNLYKEVL